MPLGNEIFAGNRAGVTTLEEIVAVMVARYGKANRIWAPDRVRGSAGRNDCLGGQDQAIPHG